MTSNVLVSSTLLLFSVKYNFNQCYLRCLQQFVKFYNFFQFDDGKAVFDGEFNAANIKSFVSAEKIALVTEFSDEVSA